MTLPVKNNSERWLLPVSTATSIFLGSALLVFFCLLWLVFICRNSSFDEHIFSIISLHITAGNTRFMKGISFLGNHNFLIPANFILIVFFIIDKNKWAAIRVAVVALSSLGLMSLLKNLFQRHRPASPLVEGITNFSFPSGHAFMSMAFYGLLIYFIRQGFSKSWLRNGVIVLLGLFILLIGFSRIYLRVHYTSDVLAGFSLGFIWLLVSLGIMDRLQQRFQRKETAL